MTKDYTDVYKRVHHIINTLVAIGVLLKKGRAVQLNDKKYMKKIGLGALSIGGKSNNSNNNKEKD